MMLDLDQRVTEGLRELATRAPIDADVWPAAERHVTRRRRHRRSIGVVVVVIALLGVGISAAVVVGNRDSKVVVASPVPPLPLAGPIEGFFTIRAAPAGKLVFQPSSVTVSTGIYEISLVGGSNTSHTLDFDDPSTLWSPVAVDAYGDVDTSRAFFGHAGDYTFYCTVPGHRAAGMIGVVHVTGPTMTLEHAEAVADEQAYG